MIESNANPESRPGMDNFGMKWSEPREVSTRHGMRMLRTARPSEAFWQRWARNRDGLRQQGIRPRKNDNGAWTVEHWTEPGDEPSRTPTRGGEPEDGGLDIPVPEGLEYFGYQKKGIEFLLPKKCALLADEMGLGKTVQAIGVANACEEIERILVICPNGAKSIWEEELDTWLVRKRPIVVISERKWNVPEHGPVAVITNYERLRNKKVHECLRQYRWDFLIADEAHRIKNIEALRTKEIRGVWDGRKGDWEKYPIPSRRKLLMTGTPILTRPRDLFSLLNYLDRQTWDSWFRFGVRYCNGHEGEFGWNFNGSSNLEELNERLTNSIMIRRRKEEVLADLPPKIRQTVIIDPSSDAMWQAVREEQGVQSALEKALASGKLRNKDHKGKERQYLLQEISRVRRETAIAKVPAVVEHMDTVMDQTSQAIIFAHHHDVIESLRYYLDPKYGCAVATGQENDRQKKAAADLFRSGKKRIFLGSMFAVGEAITLTCANHVVFAELDWSPGIMAQAEDRAHRVGQDDKVLVQHVVLNGSMDAKLAKVMVRKQGIIERAIDGRDILEWEDVELVLTQ